MTSDKNLLYAVFDVQRISDGELEYMKRYLPEYRLQKAQRYRRREDHVNCIVRSDDLLNLVYWYID